MGTQVSLNEHAAKCTAKSKRTGNPCRNAAVTGATVCRLHGGAAPQVRRAGAVRAARLEAHAEAERMVARAGVDADPIEHLLESLHRAAALCEVWGQMVAALDAKAEREARQAETLRGELGYDVDRDPASPNDLVVRPGDLLLALNYRGEAHVHPFVTEYQTALDRRARFAKLCIDAGIAERQVRLAEQQAQVMVQILRAFAEDQGVEWTPDVAKSAGRHLRLVAGS